MSDRSESIFDGRRGAVSLTFDDGTTNQLLRAVPRLDERGIKATFYLNPRDSLLADHLDSWRDVSSTGHEIGNHTLRHPCPGAITGDRGLEHLTLGDIESDIDAAQQRLLTIAPQQDAWTFAYPCYATYVGRGVDRRSYVPVVARRFLAGRAGGEVGFGNRPGSTDLAALHGMAVERLTLAETILIVDRLTAQGQWVILVLHDIESGVLPVEAGYYTGLLDFLVDKTSQILTGSVAEIARRVARLQAHVPVDT